MATPLTVAGAVIAPGIGPGEKALEFACGKPIIKEIILLELNTK